VKPAIEQGHYLHPELFGAPPEMSVTAAHQTAAASGSATASQTSAAQPDTESTDEMGAE
jgi:hypothetical protein